MTATRLVLTCCVGLFWAVHASAQEDADDAVGWGDTSSVATSPVAAADSKLDAAMSGSLRSDWAMWTRPSDQPNRFAKGRQSLDLELRIRTDHARLVLGAHVMHDLAYLVDTGAYGQATRDTYETLIRGRDSYLALTFDHVEVAAGLQRVTFGAGELFSVVDVVNPRDQREPGLTDLEDSRLPVLMSRLTTFWKRHRVEVIGVHEAYFQLRPPPLAYYSPVREILLESPLGPFVTPERLAAGIDYRDDPGRWDWASQQAFGRWTFSGPRLDAGLYAGSAIGYLGIIDLDAAQLQALGAEDSVQVPLLHKRYTTVGASAAKPLGDWLFHGELAVDAQLPVQLADLSEQSALDFTFVRRTLVRWLAGVRYTGIKSGAITVEYTQGSTGDVLQGAYSPSPLLPINPFFVGARWQQAFVRDRLILEGVLVAVGPRDRLGGFVRAQATYKVVSNLRVTAGYIAYLAGDVPSLLNGYSQNDRLFVRLRYDFATE